MKRINIYLLFLILTFITAEKAIAQSYNFSDFVGNWSGNIASKNNGYNYPTTIDIYSDGFYTESSGSLMPTIYTNTQLCEFDVSTNRMHFWWLQTVYSGMKFYTHSYYEIVRFSNDTLEMHYNFWDDPIPHPSVETIYLTRNTTTGFEDGITYQDNDRKLIRVMDLTGRELPHDTKGQLLIYQYDDGTLEKRFVIE